MKGRLPAELEDADRVPTLVVIPLDLHVRHVREMMYLAREGCLVVFAYGVWLGAVLAMEWPPPLWLSFGAMSISILVLARKPLRRVLW